MLEFKKNGLSDGYTKTTIRIESKIYFSNVFRRAGYETRTTTKGGAPLQEYLRITFGILLVHPGAKPRGIALNKRVCCRISFNCNFHFSTAKNSSFVARFSLNMPPHSSFFSLENRKFRSEANSATDPKKYRQIIKYHLICTSHIYANSIRIIRTPLKLTKTRSKGKHIIVSIKKYIDVGVLTPPSTKGCFLWNPHSFCSPRRAGGV